MFTSALPLINGEKETGVTLHKIDAGIDTGDIIDQIKFQIKDSDTARDIYYKYLRHSKKLLAVNLHKILKDEVSAYPQPAKGSSYYSKNSIDFKNLKIELSATAEQIKNQIRAYSFPEFQVPKIHGYFVNSSKITEVKSTKKFGSIISVNPSFLVISQ